MPDAELKAILQKLTIYAKKNLPTKNAAEILSFIEQYYAHAPIEDLKAREIRDLYGAVLSHWELMSCRSPGQYKRRIFNPTLQIDGWESNHTVLEFILDDQPFLVDTLCTEINRKGFTVHFIIHLGGIKVLRNSKHQITRILPFNAHAKGVLVEAPIYIEIDKQTDPAVLKELEKDLDRVIDDARAAISDWQKMETQVHFALEEIEQVKPPVADEEIEETKAFLHWLLDNHFTFLGFRNYDRVGKGKKQALRLVPHSGLGVLRDTSQSKVLRYYAELPHEARKLTLSNQLILLAKTNTRSTVHGSRYTDFISIKRFNLAGEVIGERWFIGLYTSHVYNDDPKSFPLVRLKVADVLKRSGLTKNGYAYKALGHILRTLPRDDLFHASADELFDLGTGILHLQDRRCIRMFSRTDVFGRFISCLVYVPRDDFNMELCYRMEKLLKASFEALEISYTTTFLDSILTRINFTVRVDPKKPHDYNLTAIEQKLIEIGRSWREALHQQLRVTFGEETGNVLALRYDRAFSSAYREAFSPELAVLDIEHFEKLSSTSQLEMGVYRPENASPQALRFKLYNLATTIPLSDAIPILEKMGLRVIGEQPYRIELKDGQYAWINDFDMRYSKQPTINLTENKQIFKDAFNAIWHGRAEHDGFNALVLGAQLNWQEVTILRGYAKYLKQIGFTFSQDYIEQALNNNPDITRLLIALFYEQFNPARQKHEKGVSKKASRQKIIDAIKEALENVANLDEDRILRMFLTIIRASVRTNFFQVDAKGHPKAYISFKFNPTRIRDLPLPRPQHEIFVYAPHVEGVHLRAGDVARGGIRWSDRREDFRREILGLMKAQQVKNAVIVPAGAKGGFITKLLAADADRDAILKEGIRCYQDFIRGLLDLTDNLQGNDVIHPENTVCRDDDDPYLVVAADKGTATFSDIANQISKDYGFWLDDAFASGGSSGYDHKKIAITARGAWESVKCHFQELDRDIANTPFTVIGIGDMAGDVFGNGMLLSTQIKLLAAFNGTHIFLDPDPNPATSFKERQRLFHLSRSTWEDYNPKLISKGGGVFKRNVKSIKLSPEIKKALDIDKNSLTPNDLIKAILVAPVDLLWNGGIGTFVKASAETHLDAGDRNSDGIRVNGNELRCRVVGEGGNLGFTQLARIEYALNNGQINTDFIDNSGGVDCSDHEVNIKILLNERVAHKQMTLKQRNLLLVKMTDEVAQLVLHNNYRQAHAVTTGANQSLTYLSLYDRYLKDMAKQGKIDLKLEFLPDNEVLAARRVAGKGLTRPEIAILLAYSKIILKSEIIQSDLPEDDYLNHFIDFAFPALLRKPPYGKLLPQHRLRREIMATQLSNLLITDMGITFVYQMYDETNASLPNIVRAYVITLEIFNLEELWETVETLAIPAQLQFDLTQEIVRLMRRSVRWLLRNQSFGPSVKTTIEIFARGIQQLDIATLLTPTEKSHIEEKSNQWINTGVPKDIAIKLASTRPMYSLLNIIKTTLECRAKPEEIANLYFSLADRLELEAFREKINEYPVETHWMLLARSAAKGDLDFQQRALTLGVYRLNKKNKSPVDFLDAWCEKHQAAIERWKSTFTEMKAATSLEYSMLVVVMRELSELAQVTAG